MEHPHEKVPNLDRHPAASRRRLRSCYRHSSWHMPLKLTDDFAAGGIDEQLDAGAILVERVELAAGVLQLGFLHFVPERLDFGLQRFEREPPSLRRGGAGAA